MSPVPSFAITRFIVPGDPVPKGRPRVGNGFVYTPRETQRAEHTVKVIARQAKVRPLSGPVSVELRFFRATERRVDADNLAKLCLDALNGIAWKDDSQIVHLRVTKATDPANPRTEVEVGPHPSGEGGGDWAALEAHEDAVAERRRRIKGDEPA